MKAHKNNQGMLNILPAWVNILDSCHLVKNSVVVGRGGGGGGGGGLDGGWYLFPSLPLN